MIWMLLIFIIDNGKMVSTEKIMYSSYETCLYGQEAITKVLRQSNVTKLRSICIEIPKKD